MIKKISQNEQMNIQSAIQCKGGEGGEWLLAVHQQFMGYCRKLFSLCYTHTHTLAHKHTHIIGGGTLNSGNGFLIPILKKSIF